MDASSIELLLRALGCSKIREGNNGWVRSSCPFATWKHRRGIDEHPSFGVSVVPDGGSHFKCYTCNSSGTVVQLVWKVEQLSGRKYPELRELIQKTNHMSPQTMRDRLDRSQYLPKPPRVVAGIEVAESTLGRLDKNVSLPYLPEDHLTGIRLMSAEALAYLKGPKRRLTDESIRLWELGWSDPARRIAIPIRDRSKKLAGISGRALDPWVEPKYMHSKGFRRDFFLYGEHLVEKEGEVGYLVEGFFDAIYLRQAGVGNVVAMLGSYLSKFQIEKLVQLFSRVVLVPDGDDPGYEAADRILIGLGSRMPVSVADVPMGKDPDELSPEEIEDVIRLGNKEDSS